MRRMKNQQKAMKVFHHWRLSFESPSPQVYSPREDNQGVDDLVLEWYVEIQANSKYYMIVISSDEGSSDIGSSDEISSQGEFFLTIFMQCDIYELVYVMFVVISIVIEY